MALIRKYSPEDQASLAPSPQPGACSGSMPRTFLLCKTLQHFKLGSPVFLHSRGPAKECCCGVSSNLLHPLAKSAVESCHSCRPPPATLSTLPFF
eukprot:1161799-Pelagomonas_calceolata.AAC.8